MSIRERWYADGWEFTQGDVRDVEYRTGQLETPAARGDNAVVPNRTGARWRPKVHGPGRFNLDVWFGVNQRHAQEAWDELTKAVVQPHRLVTYRRVTPAGEVRTCLGEVTAALQPNNIGQEAYRASIEVVVPGGYWRGDTTHTAATPAGGGDVDLVGLAPSTAALEELELTVTGYAKRPMVTDLTDRGRGEWLRYDRTVEKDTSVAFDCATWATTTTGGHVVSQAAINYPGDAFLVVAAPPPGVVPRLRLTGEELGPDARLTVVGRRSYLC